MKVATAFLTGLVLGAAATWGAARYQLHTSAIGMFYRFDTFTGHTWQARPADNTWQPTHEPASPATFSFEEARP